MSRRKKSVLPVKRRLTKADRIAARAEALARGLADAPSANDDPLAPPAFIDNPALAGAAQVWQDYAPILKFNKQLERSDRLLFALFCIYASEFVAAQDEIQRKGFSTMVKTISGDRMPRYNPAIAVRDIAARFMLELSKRFGLSPLDRHSLRRAEAASGAGPLFDGTTGQEPLSASDPWVELTAVK